MSEPTETQLVFLPRWVTAEVESLALWLSIAPDMLLAAAWEVAKTELHRAVMPAPPIVVLEQLTVPDAPPANAEELPDAPFEDEKVRRRLDLPSRTMIELEALAEATGQSASTLLAQAYELARHRLHHAKVTS